MMNIDGERVWVPTARQDLVKGLQRMGIYKVAGQPLAELTPKQLTAAYCSERARIVRRKHQERRKDQQRASSTKDETMIQLTLVPN